MSSEYGGIYRLPPTPQRSKPSAILPAEVFPNPPLGNPRRGIVLAIVAAQWIWVPPPVQRPPVVTESAVIVPHVPLVRVQDRVVVDSWQTVPQPQRFNPTATLPAEVFDNPPLETRRLVTNLNLIASSWLPDPQPQQRLARLVEVVADFIPFSRDRLVTGLWESIPATPRRPLRAILPLKVFDDPPLGDIGREYIGVLVESWRTVPQPQKSRPTAILPADVGDSPLVDVRHRSRALEALTWIPGPEPHQRGPRVTKGIEPVVSHVRDRVVTGLWELIPTPQQRAARAATLLAVVFDDPPIDTERRATMDLVVVSWRPGPGPQQRRPVVTEGLKVFVPSSRDRVVIDLWRIAFQHQQRRPVVTEAAFVPRPGRQHDRVIIESWHVVPPPQRRVPVFTESVGITDLCGPLRSALVEPNRVSAFDDPNRDSALLEPNRDSAFVDPDRKSAFIDPRRLSDLECD